MVNRDLLAEAIADAKAVKETAIANAKAALEEAFAPRMHELLKAKLAEMDKEELEEAEEMEEGVEEMTEANDTEGYEGQMGKKHLGTKEVDEAEEMNLDELLKELDELEENINLTDTETTPTEHGNIEEEEEKEEGEEKVEDTEEEEEIDLENMSEDDLKKFIEDVIADMVEAGELEAGEGAEGEEEIEGEETEEEEITERKKYGGNKGDIPAAKRGKIKKDTAEEEGIEDYKKKMKESYDVEEGIDEIVGSGTDFARLADVLGTSIEAAKYLVTAFGLSLPIILMIIKVGGEKIKSFLKKVAEKNSVAETEETNEMKAELEEAYKTISTIKEELAEVNLFNAKLLYTNKIFKAKNLSEAQKVKVLAAFDKAASVKEAELVFETLNEGMTAKKAPMNESLIHGGASKAAGVATKKPIMEANDQVTRWQKLAGIK